MILVIIIVSFVSWYNYFVFISVMALLYVHVSHNMYVRLFPSKACHYFYNVTFAANHSECVNSKSHTLMWWENQELCHITAPITEPFSKWSRFSLLHYAYHVIIVSSAPFKNQSSFDGELVSFKIWLLMSPCLKSCQLAWLKSKRC